MKLAALFSDNVVLQHGRPAAVWGWAKPGASVTVTFSPSAGSANAEQSQTARAGDDGRWLVRLAPLAVCDRPARLTAAADGGERAVAENVLVGEVWLCSGQSNMQWVVGNSASADAEIAAADFPRIRMFTVAREVCEQPPADVQGVWAVCSPQTVGEFSAVAYHFGLELHRHEGVPIGLLNSSWGGTRVETWISREALMADAACREEVVGYERVLAATHDERKRSLAEYQRDPADWLRHHVAPDPGNEGLARGWADAALADADWPAMELPAPWQTRGVAGNGVVWFRRQVDVPADWAGRDLVLRLGACDKHDITYFNNEQVGATSWETDAPWAVQRTYRVPGRLVRAGTNLIACRVYSYRNAGGLMGPAEEMLLEPDGGNGAAPAAVPLAGQWRYAVEHNFGVIRAVGEPELLPNHNSPYALYQSMIGPLLPFAVRGTIWYQGESNAGDALSYRTRFPMLIRDWRSAWDDREMPFLFVQLANYVSIPGPGQRTDGWPRLREAQSMTLAEPATGMAVAIDVGDPVDIHPKNKREVGRRLALAARAMVHGRDVVFSGPLYDSMAVAGREVRVRFRHADGGLVAERRFDAHGLPLAEPVADAALTGFEVAGADGRFVAADACIDGDEVVVSSAGVADPVDVRYAWADNPSCNLYSSAGLPASPFRTDEA